MLNNLDIHSISLVTNNMEKVKILEKHNIKIINRVNANFDINNYNINYLRTKKSCMGHILEL